MSISFTSKPALILIDIQKGFDEPIWGRRNNPDAETNARRLLDTWRAAGLPIFHVQHLSVSPTSVLRPDHPGSAIKDLVAPLDGEPVITKNVNSAFIGTDLEKRLHAASITQVVLAGITTDHCVSTSTRMAANLGFTAIISMDATYTFDRVSPDGRKWSAEDIHSTALASLHGEFATALSTTDIIAKVAQPALATSK
jgi:nicotinamidase-related amidase